MLVCSPAVPVVSIAVGLVGRFHSLLSASAKVDRYVYQRVR